MAEHAEVHVDEGSTRIADRESPKAESVIQKVTSQNLVKRVWNIIFLYYIQGIFFTLYILKKSLV